MINLLIKQKTTDIIEITCDNCNIKYNKTLKNQRTCYKKHNKDLCTKCAHINGAQKRPQCTKEYWTEEIKNKLSENIKKSEKYIEGIKNRPDNSKENNPMYNKHHSLETKKKMSESRKGKIGINSTAWKGGKLSLVQRIKTYQYRNKWYHNIYKRDNYKCTKCESKNKIEIHHIKPMKDIVKEILNIHNDEIIAYNILINLPINLTLDNGIVLCRNCHRNIHLNWGSHNPIIK